MVPVRCHRAYMNLAACVIWDIIRVAVFDGTHFRCSIYSFGRSGDILTNTDHIRRLIYRLFIRER